MSDGISVDGAPDDWDPYETHIEDREDIRVGLEYLGSADIRRLIWKLNDGDKIEITRYGKSYGDKELIVQKHIGDQAIVSDSSGKLYYLIAAYYPPNWEHTGSPWLRTKKDYNSAGEIESIKVLSLHE